MIHNLSVLLMQPSGDPAAAGSPLMSPLLIGGIMLVFWLFFIRPQAKKAKEQKKFLENLGKGDRIVTIAGIHGTISRVNDDNTFQLEVSPGMYMKIEKSAISSEWTAALNKPAATTTAAIADKK